MEQEAFRSGYIGIFGRPNVGKSTLLNRLVGEKLAAISPRPQTTRNRILGIKTTPGAQMVFVDTPGIHEARGPFHQYMVGEALRALREVDVVVLLVEATGRDPSKDSTLIQRLGAQEAPAILGINKIDLVAKPSLLPIIKELGSLYPFEAVVPLSALTGQGVDVLEREILAHLPPGPKYFPEDQLTDLPERFLAAEVVREKVFNLCGEEIPYAVAVVVEEFQDREPPKPTYIRAVLYVEKESQKPILIGSQGRMLKRIGTAARRDLEMVLARPVYLELWVRVERNWSRDEKRLKKMGYR
jgi:GTP-binding protein Era